MRNILLAAVALMIAEPAFAQANFDAAVTCQQQTDLYIVQDGARVTMRSITAQVRTAARAFGFGGVAQYAVLMGNRALYRLPNNHPVFIVAAPSNVQPQGLFTLARFEPRPNGSREVLIGGGFISYSTGIAPDRQVAMNVAVAANQAGAPAGTTLYELTPATALAPGEYAMIVAIGAQTSVPMGGGMPGTYYDFGVD
jgi:hypothetical protein